MNQDERSSKSKLLTFILRHHSDKFNLKLDKEGWIDINTLLNAINSSNNNKIGNITMEQVLEIVRLCDKQRFQLSEDRSKIRACQGHSLAEVELKFTKKRPPVLLFHGTVDKIVNVIMEQGINKMARHHVHLSNDLTTAIEVGKRRGAPILFLVDSKQMYADGAEFFISENNVWLTENVPPQYIKPFKIDDKCGCGGFIVLNQDKTKCLLVKATHWGFPKGKKNKNESIIQCAIRELYEETSLRENDIVIDYNYDMMFELSHTGQAAVGLFVAYANDTCSIKIIDTDELDDIGWFPLSDALNKLDGVKNRKQLLQSCR